MTENLPAVGFIGLGSMGSGMARNLFQAGFPLVVTDARPDAGAGLIELGATWADTPAEVAAQTDLVVTMLPTPLIVRGVAVGPGGILEGIRDGGTWIDMSTSVPEVTEEVSGFADGRDLTIVDAPVSGMSVGAASGTLQIFVGAEAATFERLRPVFEAMGDPERILNVGGPGAGYAVKLLINQLWFSQLVATAEVMSVGVRSGVDLEVLRRALIASPANSAFVERDVLSVLDSGDYDEGFAIALACKDLGLSVDLARSVGRRRELAAREVKIKTTARA
ncbi:MAG: NAD(P)-dependent oxidoreductase [Pseudoclavibacter sp.]